MCLWKTSISDGPDVTFYADSFTSLSMPNPLGIWHNWRYTCRKKNNQKGSGTLLVKLYKDAGTPSTECSMTKFWKALKLLSLGQCTWFKKPTLLIQASPFRWNRHWKDMGHPEICPDFTLKEHYIHTAHIKYFWAASNFYANTNLFM